MRTADQDRRLEDLMRRFDIAIAALADADDVEYARRRRELHQLDRQIAGLGVQIAKLRPDYARITLPQWTLSGISWDDPIVTAGPRLNSENIDVVPIERILDWAQAQVQDPDSDEAKLLRGWLAAHGRLQQHAGPQDMSV